MPNEPMTPPLDALLTLAERHECVTLCQEFDGAGKPVEGVYRLSLGELRDHRETFIRGDRQELIERLAEVVPDRDPDETIPPGTYYPVDDADAQILRAFRDPRFPRASIDCDDDLEAGDE